MTTIPGTEKMYSEPDNDVWATKKMAQLQWDLARHVRDRMASWIEKKDILLVRLSEQTEGSRTFTEDKRLLATELHSLETENSNLFDRLQSLQSELANRRQHSGSMLAQAERIKNTYLQCLSEKNGLKSEIQFLKTEKEKVEEILTVAVTNYQEHMADLSTIVEKIRFANGEVAMWAEKMVELETEIPEQSRELAYLNGQISSANMLLLELSDKLRAIERNVKTAFYKGKGSSL